MKKKLANTVTKTIRVTVEDHQRWKEKKKSLRKQNPSLRCTDEIVAAKLIKNHLDGLEL